MVEVYKNIFMKKNKEEIKKKIINKARQIFGQYGFRKTTMDEIAQAAKMAKSSVYYYFSSKEDVFHLVVETEFEIFKKEITKSIEAVISPQEKLICYFKTRMRAFKRLVNFYSTFKDEYLEDYSLIQKIRASYDRYEIKMIKAILREGVAKGEFSVKNLRITAFAIVTAIKGLELPWAMEKDLRKIEKEIDNLSNILFYGIMKR